MTQDMREADAESRAGDAPPRDPPPVISRRRLAIPVVLAAGWGALFSYALTALTDDGRESGAGQIRLAAAGAASLDVPEVRLPEPERPPPAGQPRLVPVAASAPPETVVAALPAELPRQAAPVLERASYVGVWGPTALACGQRQRRRGYLPATINEEGARAGRTVCRFRNNRRDGAAWTMAADCSERGRRWTSQVRLVVDQDRLTWSSGKGLANYVRCGRRSG